MRATSYEFKSRLRHHHCGLVAIRLTRRADARLGVLVGLVTVAAIAFLLAPAVILAIKNMRVESFEMLARLLEKRVTSV